MGVFDTARDVAGTVSRVVGSTVENATMAINSRINERSAQRRLEEIDEQIAKAANAAIKAGKDGSHEPARDPKALGFDPFDLVSMMGYRERPTAMSFRMMERTAETVPVLADVIGARVSEIKRFTRRPEDRHSPGFEVRHIDKKKRKTEEAKKRAFELEEIVLNCGYPDVKRKKGPLTFRQFAGMFIRDSLSFDQATFETVPDRKKRPSYFDIVDATTIRLLDQDSRREGEPFAVQVMEGMIVSDFMPEELAFCVRNPRSGIKMHGYGRSEIETLVKEITGFLWGIEYNRRFFSQGSATKGILNFKGTIPDKHMNAFRRQWYAMVQGVNNAWRTPITNADELQWINLQMSSRDMEMSAWLDFLIKVVCARYLIAPESVNFSYGNTNQAQAMGQTSIEEKLKASRDLGLKPLVEFLFEKLNKHFLQRIDPNYEAVPFGLDEKGVEAETGLLKEQTSVYMLLDEAREEVGLEPLPDEKGQCVLNPNWIQWAQSKEAMGEGGEPGEEPGAEEGGFGVEEAGPNDEHGGFALSDDEGFFGEAEAEEPEEPGGMAKSERPLVRYELTL